MTVRRHRRYSTEFEIQLVQAYLDREGSARSIATRHEVPHSLLMVWIKKYEAGDLTREIHLQEEVVEYGAKIAALERKIGQLTMELDVMKKRALIRPSQQGARPSIISGPRRPLGYRFALGALDAAERLRQIGSREAVQQMVYDQLRILGATQRTTSQLTNANGQVERQMSRSHHPVEKAMALIPVRDARQSYPPFHAVFSPFKHGSIRYGRTASAADRAVLVQLRRFLAGIQALGTPRYQRADEGQLRKALEHRRRARS